MSEPNSQDNVEQDSKSPGDTLFRDDKTPPEKKEDTPDKGLWANDPEKDPKKETDDKKDQDPEKDPKDKEDPKKEEKSDKKLGEDQETELFGKPEQYDYKDVKLPEGMKLNDVTTTQFNTLAEKLNLSQKGANEIMAIAVAHTKQVQTQLEQAFVQANETRVKSFKEALNKDPDIGGAKLKDSLAVATIAYEQFASDEVKDVLYEAGLNHHPAVIKMFHSLGKLMQDDKIHGVGKQPEKPKTHADILFGNKEKE